MCTKKHNQYNADGDSNADTDTDGRVTVIALHILRIVELKIDNNNKYLSIFSPPPWTFLAKIRETKYLKTTALLNTTHFQGCE